MAGSDTETPWGAVTARALAFQAMHLAGLGEASVVERAQFLMRLGLPRADAAAMLGTSDDSLRVNLASAAKRKAGKGHG